MVIILNKFKLFFKELESGMFLSFFSPLEESFFVDEDFLTEIVDKGVCTVFLRVVY